MPIELPAPGRFSITIGWPTCCDTWSNTMRAITSLALPAVSGTTTDRLGRPRLGQHRRGGAGEGGEPETEGEQGSAHEFISS